MHFITVIKKYNLFVHLHFIFLHMNVVCPGIKLIPLIYQHIAILVRFYTQFIFVFCTYSFYFGHNSLVRSVIKLIHLIYQHIAILVRFTHNLYLFLHLQFLFLHMNVVCPRIKLIPMIY